MSVKVTLKYGKKKIKNVEIKKDTSFEDFQGIIFSLIQVPPNRQKIICKGKLIEKKESLLKLTNKSILIITGSAEKQEIIKKELNNIKFIEDLNDSQKQDYMAILPPGLHNLGNTCYLNSCLQCIKGIPELKNKLKILSYKNNNTLGCELGLLFNKMDNSVDSVIPQEFVQFFRSKFPRFASRNPQNNVWEQQDADECLTTIFGELRKEMKLNEDESKESSNNNIQSNDIDNLFEGEFNVETKCTESDDEPITKSKETFLKLRCFIDTNTRHVSDGIMKSMSEEIEKRSNKLNRNAIWKKDARVNKLPKYLTIQFVRFYWKQNKQKNAKIVRRVIFPHKLDAYPFCSKLLQEHIEQYRLKKLQKEDKNREKNQKVNISDNNNNNNNNKDKDKKKDVVNKDDANKNNNNNDKDNANDKDKDANNNDNNNNNDKNKEKDEEKKESDDKDKMDVDKDENNEGKEYETGYYELCGIVTHKGRSANSGHYIGYSKDLKRNVWLKFDDEDVTEMTDEDIKKLYGGGDWQMGFLCFYRKVEPEKI